jgi:hypothetical protein
MTNLVLIVRFISTGAIHPTGINEDLMLLFYGMLL